MMIVVSNGGGAADDGDGAEVMAGMMLEGWC